MSNKEKIKKEEKSLPSIISHELISNTTDLGFDYAELLIDSQTTDEVLSQVPVFKSLISGTKILGGIRGFYSTRNIMTFFKEFHSQNVSEPDLALFKIRFEDEKEYRDKVINLIVQYNDRFVDSIKSKVLANLILSHIENKIDWNRLIGLSQILDTIHPSLFEVLHKIKPNLQKGKVVVDREVEALLSSCGIGGRHGTLFYITKLGEDLFEFGVKNVSK